MSSRKRSPPAGAVPPPAAPDDPAARVLRRFRLVFNAVKTHFREVEKEAGIAGAQVWALSVIRDSPGLNLTDVARAMDVHQSTASNLVKALIARELVGAEKAGADRRTVQLRLLPAGKKILRHAPRPFAGVLPDALAAMNPRTLTRLDRDLGELITVLGVDERGAGIPLGQPQSGS
ncbi:MAG: MarR family transcriptional regulator [Ramlibacter sp.]